MKKSHAFFFFSRKVRSYIFYDRNETFCRVVNFNRTRVQNSVLSAAGWGVVERNGTLTRGTTIENLINFRVALDKLISK